MNQIACGNGSILGLLLESFIEAGSQPIPADLSQLQYGCSVTDACLDWPTTEKAIRAARGVLHGPLTARG